MKLSFVRGSALRKVFIKGRKISFMTGELGFTPYTIDLDKIDKIDKKSLRKLDKEYKEDIKESKAIKTEEEAAQSIIKDLRKQGWKVFKKE